MQGAISQSNSRFTGNQSSDKNEKNGLSGSRLQMTQDTNMTSTTHNENTLQISGRPRGPWGLALEQLYEWDPGWAEICARMTTDPWIRGVLPRKTIELISIAVNVACTNLNLEGARIHIRAALEAGVTREEILTVLKMASLLAIHSCSKGASILLEEARDAGIELPQHEIVDDYASAFDTMRTSGQWNQEWNSIVELDPLWTNQFVATGISIYASGVISSKLMEFINIAFSVAFTHRYAPGIREHIKAALGLGASVEEIMEVLKVCAAQGVQSCNLGVPILAEEIDELESMERTKR